MANRAKPIKNLPVKSTATSTDILVLVANNAGNPVTAQISVNNFFGNSSFDFIAGGNHIISANTFIIRREQTPANSTITVSKGTIFFDADYLYIAVANNTLKRVTLSSF